MINPILLYEGDFEAGYSGYMEVGNQFIACVGSTLQMFLDSANDVLDCAFEDRYTAPSVQDIYPQLEVYMDKINVYDNTFKLFDTTREEVLNHLNNAEKPEPFLFILQYRLQIANEITRKDIDISEYTYTRKQVLELIQSGHRFKHCTYADGEYVYSYDGKNEFSNGLRPVDNLFQTTIYKDGWQLYNG